MFTGLVVIAVIVAVLGSLRPRAAAPGPHVAVVGPRRRRDRPDRARRHHRAVRSQPGAGGLPLPALDRPRHQRGGAAPPGRPKTSLRGPRRRSAPRRLGNVLLVAALAVIVAGTVVTGTGPHGGDETAPPLPARDDRRGSRARRSWCSVLVGLTVALGVGVAPRRRHAGRAASRLVLLGDRGRAGRGRLHAVLQRRAAAARRRPRDRRARGVDRRAAGTPRVVVAA